MHYENKWYVFDRIFCSPLEKVAQVGHRGVRGRSWVGAADVLNHVQHRRQGNGRHRIAELPSQFLISCTSFRRRTSAWALRSRPCELLGFRVTFDFALLY